MAVTWKKLAYADTVEFYPQKDTNCQLYLPLYDWDLRGDEALVSKDKNLHVCTITGALWTPQGRVFDGVDNYVDIASGVAPAGLPTGASARTLIAWVKPITFPPTDYDVYVSYGGTAAFNYLFEILVAPDGAVHYHTWGYHPAIGSISIGTWSMIAMVYDGTNRIGYVNGVKTLEAAMAINTASSPIYIGRSLASAYPRWANCIIGDVWIYNCLLTPAEIQQIYLASKWRYQ